MTYRWTMCALLALAVLAGTAGMAYAETVTIHPNNPHLQSHHQWFHHNHKNTKHH